MMYPPCNTPEEESCSSTSTDSQSGSEDSDTGVAAPVNGGHPRVKRRVSWRDIAMQETTYSPSSTSGASTSTYNSRRLQLFCQTGYFLAIYPDGRVRGTDDASDLHTQLEMINTDYPGHVLIRATLVNLYLRIRPNGRLRGTASRQKRGVLFIEGVLGFYMTYLCLDHAHLGWYVGIKKSGKFKNARKTLLHQKAVHFVKRYRS